MIEHKHEHKQAKPKWQEFLPHFAFLALICLAIGAFAGNSLFASLASEPTPETSGISSLEAKGIVEDYINLRLPAEAGANAEATYVGESNGLLEFSVDFIQSGIVVQSLDAFVTPDGATMFTNAFDLKEEVPEQPSPSPEPELVKTARPEAEVFVMSYCPYGLQFEKAVLPVWELLGEKADIKVKFVYYTMHGEEEAMENTRQYCINEEYGEAKHWEYFECFAGSGNTSACINASGFNATLIESCVNETHEEFEIDPAQPAYDLFAADNEAYNVGGSPTFVLNGKTMQVSRSPEAIKQAICSAFIEAPEECDTVLSETQTSPGFGFEEGSGSSGTC